MIGKQIIEYIPLFKLKGIDSKDVRHKNDDSCRRIKKFTSFFSEKKSFKITSYRKENFSTTGLPSKRIKRRSDGEISSVERGDKRSKSQKKKKKKKKENKNW